MKPKARKKKLINKGSYLVNESNRGLMTAFTECVVMDNSISTVPAHNKKLKVTYFITENSKLLAGANTVALFKIKKRLAANQAQELFESNTL